jgi:hypothetical protein
LVLSAAAIERLLEPLSPWLLSKKQEKDDEAKAVKTATDLAEDPAVPADEVKAAVQVAAVAKAVVSRKESERAVAHWAVASVLALIVPAVLGVFLRSVSTGSAPNAFVDMAFTALIVGAGTKPLHETISFIQAKKKTAEAAADKA